MVATFLPRLRLLAVLVASPAGELPVTIPAGHPVLRHRLVGAVLDEVDAAVLLLCGTVAEVELAELPIELHHFWLGIDITNYINAAVRHVDVVHLTRFADWRDWRATTKLLLLIFIVQFQ